MKKRNIWEEIAAVLKDYGFNMTGKQVEGRWKTITASYRRVVDNNNTTGRGRRTCAFFEELSEVYGYRPNVRPRVLYDNERRQCDPQPEPKPGQSTSEPATSNKQPGPSTPQPSRKKQKAKKDTYLDWLKEQAEASHQEEEQKLLVVRQADRRKSRNCWW